MKTGRDFASKFLSVEISVLMLTLSAVVPVMERSELVHEPVAESQHNPATCPPAHDHTVCTQVGANLSLAAGHAAERARHVVLRSPLPSQTFAWASATFDEGHPARAPPLS